jgi:RNA polymerase sigma factor (TIGR02999 family)
MIWSKDLSVDEGAAMRMENDGIEATPELFSLLYQELRQLAHSRLRKNEPITLLDTTSLVHETYLRVVNAGRLGIADRSQFLAYSAHVMRSIVVDFVRQRRAERRGGGQQHETLDTAAADSVRSPEDEIIRVSDALDDLAKVDERLVKVVEMRYFTGLSEEDIALALGVNERTVRRDWQKARLLLSLSLQ